MIHFGMMLLFALVVAIVFGLVGRDTTGERLKYGAKVFAEFTAVGIALSWILYFFPL
ncbi:MAG: hypothetical protein ABIP75_02725 [Pyrinomonadaceae bacterium]